MRWVWDPKKNRENRKKHGLSFETAEFVFADPMALSKMDDNAEEERWVTIGSVDGVLLFVVHTSVEEGSISDDHVGRIISARKATKRERRAYEEGDL